MCTMIHSSYTQGHTDFNMSVCVVPDMRFVQWKNWKHTVEAIVKISAQVDGEGITSSLTRTQSWLWTLPLLCVWLIHLQIRTGGITVRDRGKSSDIHKPLSRAATVTFILLSMTVLCLSLFHLLLLPIIASSPVSLLPVWSTLSLSTPPQENKTKSVEIRAWSESDAGNNESEALHVFSFIFTFKSREMCGQGVCVCVGGGRKHRRGENRHWAGKKRVEEHHFHSACTVRCRKGSAFNGICRSPAQIRRNGRNDCWNDFILGDVLGSH